MDVVNCIMELNLEGFASKYGINRLKGNINLYMKLPVQAQHIPARAQSVYPCSCSEDRTLGVSAMGQE